jgi:hypothetical protein
MRWFLGLIWVGLLSAQVGVFPPASTSSGTVTAVACGTVPNWLTCSFASGSSTPTLTLASATGQTANQVLGTDSSGNVGIFSLTAAHVPNLASTKITGLAASATTDTTNAANITTGTLPTGVMPATIFPGGVLDGSKTLATLDQIPVQTQTVGYQPNQVQSGCGVDYLSGLTYQIGACTFLINGATYSTAAVQKTLATADVTNPRIDAIGVQIDSSGVPNVFVTAGTPAANPSAPVVDSATSIGLSFPQVNASQTIPANSAKTTLFDIGSEWTLTPSTHFALSTSNPYSETHDIEATAAVLTNNFTLVKPASATEDLSTRNNLVFYIRSKAAWPTGNSGSTAARTLTLFWRNGATQIGAQVVLRDGQFGFSSANTTTYQLISIPISLFATSTNLVTTLVAQVTGNTGTASIGFYIDAISLQGGTTVQTLPTTLMNFKGAWNSATAYSPNDLTTSGGLAYVAKAANTNQLVTNATYWTALSTAPVTVGFSLGTGATGTNVAGYIPASHSGTISRCVVLVKISDATTPLTFTVRKNGTAIFSSSNTVAAGSVAGTLSVFTNLSTTTVVQDDKFSLDITSGNSNWQATIQVE